MTTGLRASDTMGPRRGRVPGGTLVLLDVQADGLDSAVAAVIEELRAGSDAPEHVAEVSRILREQADLGPKVHENGVAVIHAQLETPGSALQLLVRFAEPLPVRDATGRHLRFMWVLLGHEATHLHADAAAEFAHLMEDPRFEAEAVAAATPLELADVYERWLEDELHFHHDHIPEELRPTGELFGGVRADVRRKAPRWVSDFTDALTMKTIASTIFLYFACLAPTVAFGGLLSVMTERRIGVVETMVATAITGILYGLFAGQPLSILGSTGPIVIFIGLVYSMCGMLDIPFLPTFAWVGLWTSAYLLLVVAFDATSWIRFFTRFTDDTFAALISLIYMYEALKDIVLVFTQQAVSYATALLSVILAIGTFMIATNLSRFRASPYLRRPVREFIADFGPTIAIFTMTGVAFALHEVDLETLAVPEQFGTTMGRGWLVNPFDAPPWVWWWASVPAVLGAILVYLDQNITVRLVNNPRNKLRKGGGYHLDMTIVALLTGAFSLFGLPWTVAATVRSLNHVRSLEVVEQTGAGEKVVGVVENRVTQLGINLLIGASLLLLPLLRTIPMSVLFGLFLFMGVASMRGNQFFERLRLWILDPRHYPPTYYLRAVPARVIHVFTAVQATCLAVLWVVKSSPAGILFPLFIALLVPVRMAMERLFKREHLALLDADEAPEDEQHKEVGA